jgi:hypothetical protein
MKYYRRYKQDGATFYVDEQGVPVAEATAKTNLVETASKRTEILEGRSQQGKSLEQQLQDRDAELARLRGGKDRLLDACKGLSDSEEEAALLAKLLREA